MSAKLSLKEGEVCGHRTVFQEPWWLDAATNGGWSEVRVERDGRLEGWLPFAVSRDMGFVRCGLPPLTRLLHPIVDVKASKSESLARARFKIESQLIANLPRASAYMFVLSPDHGNALAWQTAGFEARVEHTYVIDAQTPKDDVWRQMNAKTRNLIRRAEDALTIRDLGTDEFVAQYRANLDGLIDEDHIACARRIVEAVQANGHGRVVGAVDGEGRIHAASVFVWDRTDCYYFLSTRDAALAVPGAVAMLLWHGMTDAIARGLRFDFDGVSSASRLKFLQSFGGRLASRIIVSRASTAYDARLLLRRARLRMRVGGPGERFY